MTINFILLLISILFFQIWSFSCTLSTISPFTGFLLFAFLFFIYWMLYRAVKKARTVSRRNAEFAAMKEQARLRQDQDFLIQESLKKNRQFQEQTKKQLEVYRSYLENQEYEKASACISHLASDFQQKRFHPICSDDLINAILAHKQSLAKSHNIHVEYKILLPDYLDILPSDLSSVFFNLMDNGIDGCMQSGSKSPFIRLTTSFASDFISIQMCNSKNPSQHFDHKTSKQNSISHGFGLSIIQDICDKNDGTCQWEDKGEVFESTVLLRYQ